MSRFHENTASDRAPSKFSTGVLTAASGSLFHRLIVRGKKDDLKTDVRHAISRISRNGLVYGI